MKARYFSITAAAVFFAACASKGGAGNATQTTDTVKTTTVTAVSHAPKDTVVITERSALFFNPDSVQIEKAKKDGPEEEFYTAADDYMYYESDAHIFFDSVKLKNADIQGKKILRFVRADKSVTYVDLDTIPDLWGVFFFDPAKAPCRPDVIDAKEEYEKYFK